MTPLRIFLWAVAFTYAFFYEYLPPVRRVHIPYDLEGYHLPLADYAFQQLKQGRWPQWDPSIYSGMSFTSNVQAALFYPGTWLMFAATWGRERLSYQSLEDLNLLHVPLAFTLCFFWLRRKQLDALAAALGALVYAYSGFLCVQLQHFGQVVAYAWLPLALIGIDDVAETKSWRRLWKVAVASALAFLGGYPPTWLVIAFTMGVYALARSGRSRTVPGTLAALLFSLALCGAQLLPTWEATHFREPELRYGIGIKDPMYFISYIVPNYWDFALNTPVMTNFGKEYLYLGASGIFGVVLAFWSRRWQALGPGLAMIAACLIVTTNPYAIVWDSIKFSSLLADVVRSAYYLAGVMPGLALVAAIGIDAFLKRSGGIRAWIAIVPLAAWAGYGLTRWFGAGFSPGPFSALDTALGLIAFTLGLLAYRRERKLWLGLALLAAVAVEYKVFGTSKRVNASPGQGQMYSSTEFGAMNREAYQETLRYPDYRVVLHQFGPNTSDLRHVGWKSPQGFDPFVSTAYLKLGTRDGTWGDDRSWILDPMRLDVMQRFGARFVLTGEAGSKFKELVAHPRYRMVGANNSYYKVFEYLDAKPIYGFEGTVQVQRRDPEHRTLQVASPTGGLLTFAEQSYPGWRAAIDGAPVSIEPWEIAFQAVRVPPGEHTVEFVYQERLLGQGIAISLVSLALLVWWILRVPEGGRSGS